MWSDVVCPWCYLGLGRFRAALDRFEHRDEVELVFRPYQLDPTAPPEPSSILDAYARKFGGPGNAVRIVADMTATAAAEGLEFNLEQALRVNTFDAHRLGVLAAGHGLDVDVHERLFAAYFTEARDLSDREVLAELAAEVGIQREEARGWLAGDGGVSEVREGLGTAAALGITAVPSFVIDRSAMVPGAQDPDTFLLVLERLHEKGREADG